jgi:hypothetical protein
MLLEISVPRVPIVVRKVELGNGDRTIGGIFGALSQESHWNSAPLARLVKVTRLVRRLAPCDSDLEACLEFMKIVDSGKSQLELAVLADVAIFSDLAIKTNKQNRRSQ